MSEIQNFLERGTQGLEHVSHPVIIFCLLPCQDFLYYSVQSDTDGNFQEFFISHFLFQYLIMNVFKYFNLCHSRHALTKSVEYCAKPQAHKIQEGGSLVLALQQCPELPPSVDEESCEEE